MAALAEARTGIDARAPLLIFGYGNPSRGDDALGPLAIDALAERLAHCGDVELLTDFQLQVEHALDLRGRRAVLFVDAARTAGGMLAFHAVAPQQDATFTSHSLSPAAVLAVLAGLGEALPATEVLPIPGETFDLGAPLSAAARQRLGRAVDAIVTDWLVRHRA